MAETQLISISDLTAYRKIDPKFNEDRFNSFVTSIQRNNLRSLLGDAMYYDFMEDDRTSGIYYDLLNGKEYTYNGETIRYYGLKPVLSFWTLMVMARESDMYQSGYGAISFTDNAQQQMLPAKEKERIAQSYLEEATRYANDVRKFLSTNYTDYPLWEYKNKVNDKGLTTFKL